MNENIYTDSESKASWPNGGSPLQEPGTSALLESGDALPPAPALMEKAVDGAHSTIDRMADGAAPAIRQLGDSASAAKDALQEKAKQLRDTGDQWTDSVRAKVRGNPLVSIAAALALGALVTRLTSAGR